MSENLDLNIIIPAYNAKETLDKTLMSLCLQRTKYKFDVLVVNDKSDYNYKNIINKYNNYLNIKELELKENVGPGLARQKGIEQTKSKYIMFIDADDLLYDADSIKKLFNKIEEDYDYVVGITIDEKQNTQIMNESDLHGKIYKREFLLKNNIKFNNTRVHEDNYFNNLVLLCEPKQKEILEKIYIYVDNKDSITNINKEKEFENLEIYISNIKEIIEEATKRNIEKDLIIKYLIMKLKYINRIYNKLSEKQQEIFKIWLKKYDIKLEKYINNTQYDEIYNELLK